MSDVTSLLSEEQRKTVEKYKAFVLENFEGKVSRCESLSRILREIRECPNFTKIFLPAEIIKINRIERQIPEFVEIIRKQKRAFEALDAEEIIVCGLDEAMNALEEGLQMLIDFTKDTNNRLPEAPPILMLIFHPISYPVNLAKIFYQRLRKKKADKLSKNNPQKH